jgi:tetratricopeptide (TPR) repeat protein
MDEDVRNARAGRLEPRWQLPLVPVLDRQPSGLYPQRLLEEGRLDTLRAEVRDEPYARLYLARYCAEHGLLDELRELADADLGLPRLDAILAGALAGRADAWVTAALLKIGLHAQDPDVREELTELLRSRDLLGRAVTVLAAPGDTWREWALRAHLLLAQGRIEEVHAMALEDRAATADLMVAQIFSEHDMLDELHRLAERDISRHARQLALTLERLGHVDEAVAVVRARVDAGEAHVFKLLIELLVADGRADEAVAALAMGAVRAVPPGEPEHTVRLAAQKVAHLLDVQGRQEDAIDVLRAYADAPAELADLLAEQGRVDEALQVLDDAIATAREEYMGGAVERLSEQRRGLVG